MSRERRLGLEGSKIGDSKRRLESDEQIRPLEPAALQGVISGYMSSYVLFAAVELGVFDALTPGPSHSAQLARQLLLDPEAVERLLSGLVSMGLLIKTDDGQFANTEAAARCLAVGGSESMVAAVRMHEQICAPLFVHLARAVRTGLPQYAAWPFRNEATVAADCYTELARHSRQHGWFLEAMNLASQEIGSAIARCVDLRSVCRLLDLGGGGGRIACDLAAAVPGLEVLLIEQPTACVFAEATAVGAGVKDRVSVLPGDVLAPYDRYGKMDAVLASSILGDFPPAERGKLLRNAFRALRPGGLLLISETLFDAERCGPMSASLYSLIMLLSTGGDNFTAAQMAAMVEAAGFEVTQIFSQHVAGGRDLLVARRPPIQSS